MKIGDKELVQRLRTGDLCEVELAPILANRIEVLSAMLAEADALIESQNQDIGRLREKLIGIRAEIDDMENPFNGDGNPEMRQGFEVAVDQAFNIVTAALEGGE